MKDSGIEKVLSKDKKGVIALLLVVLLLGVAAAVYWLFIIKDRQSTDDANVAGNINPVSSQVAGNVVTINYADTQRVMKGDVLVVLDDTDAKIAFRKAQSALAWTVRQIHQLALQDGQYSADADRAAIALNQTQTDFRRQQQLYQKGLIARETLEHAGDAVASDKASLAAAVQLYQANKALLLNTTLRHNPQVLQAADTLREAWLALQRTKIRSPVTGYIAGRSVQVGQTVTAGQTLLSVVPQDQMWINANFKETQLNTVKIGQKVNVVIDLYGSSLVFEGAVEGVGMGTGSAFSLLPAQNASGNWIKVIQRVPVRVALDPRQIQQYPLRIGLSATATIFTAGGISTADQALAQKVSPIPAWRSMALVLDTADIDRQIEQIIAQNGGL
nr:EmrA/EmrK family multidrug efflux transporter periplasmic adaptor subunit [Erwinia sp. ErVv1]